MPSLSFHRAKPGSAPSGIMALLIALLIGAAILGSLLRWIWVEDMEYKSDERVMFRYALHLDDTPLFPWIGMETSAGIANPGMSVWIFQAPAILLGFKNPIELNRWVQSLNICALIFLIFFIFKCVPPESREVWIWAAIFMSLNPMAILFSRKLWAQCVLTPFNIGFIAAWWMRDRKWGAFFWGLLGLALGQIHISGLFLTASVFLWTVFFGKRISQLKPVRWRFWMAGTALGMIGVIQWLRLVHSQKGQNFELRHILSIQFWRYWMADSLGIQLSYSLHSAAFSDFWKYPLIAGLPTHLVGLVHILLYGFGIILISKVVRNLFRRRNQGSELLENLLGTRSDTDFLVSAIFIAYGVLITASGTLVKHHYLIVIFPVLWVWLARLTLRHLTHPRRWLLAVALLQGIISVGFLSYLHVNHGGPLGSDYGESYGAQKARGLSD